MLGSGRGSGMVIPGLPESGEVVWPGLPDVGGTAEPGSTGCEGCVEGVDEPDGTGRPDGVGPARVAVGDHTIVIEDSVRLEDGTDGATARFEGPLEAAIRLLAGRLDPAHTPEGVTVSGDVTLDDLRRVFPGY